MADVKEFLNPNSMLTPGLAGGLTVSISLPVAVAFGFSVKWLALSISALLALAIILSVKDPLSTMQRIVYGVLNSLVIFSTAVGAGINLDPPPKPPTVPAILHMQPGISGVDLPHMLLGVSTAFADEGGKPPPPNDTADQPSDRATEAAAEDKKTAGTALSAEQAEKLKAYQLRQQEYEQKQKEYGKRWSW